MKDFIIGSAYFCTGIAIALAILFTPSTDVVVGANNSQYCAMVYVWDREAAQGVSVDVRGGWPPYNGREICE